MDSITSDIKILLEICNFTSFLPHFNVKTGEFRTNPIYHTAILFLYLLTYIYMFYIKITLEGTLFPERGTTLIIASGFLFAIRSCWLLSIARNSKVYLLQRYINIFDDFDKILSRNFSIKIQPKKHAKLCSLVIVLIYLIILLICYYLWFRHIYNVHYIMHNFSDALMIMGNLVVVLIEIITLEGLGKRYGILSGIIENLTFEHDCDYRIDCLTDLHNLLSDLVMIHNDLFSWQVFGSVFNSLLVDLTGIGFFVSGYYRDEILTFVSTLLWIYIATSQVVALAAMCEKVVSKGKKCATITYKTLSRLSDIPVLRSKIIILGSQMEARMPKFTAAGFFNVDFAMIFTFFNLMVTYIIVIIQFTNNS